MYRCALVLVLLTGCGGGGSGTGPALPVWFRGGDGGGAAAAPEQVVPPGCSLTVSLAMIRSAHIRTFGLLSESREEGLVVLVEVSNSLADRRLALMGWNMTGGASVRDDLGNVYQQQTWKDGVLEAGYTASISRTLIHPEKKATDVLHFDRPLRKAEKLTLTLPLANVGGTGTMELDIPNTVWFGKR
jgi:hypothetical protein